MAAAARQALRCGSVILVTLTGGIGSGKSSVSERLAAKGAVIVDADAIAKELQAPGQPVFNAMVERFGPGIVGADGQLDRPAIAELVFNDPQALADLNNLSHPPVRRESANRVKACRGTDKVVVVDTPLVLESKDPRGQRALGAAVIVVDVEPDVAVGRLVRYRGFDEADARARIANQVSREQRKAIANYVLDNNGDLAELDARVDELWAFITGLQSEEERWPDQPAAPEAPAAR